MVTTIQLTLSSFFKTDVPVNTVVIVLTYRVKSKCLDLINLQLGKIVHCVEQRVFIVEDYLIMESTVDCKSGFIDKNVQSSN